MESEDDKTPAPDPKAAADALPVPAKEQAVAPAPEAPKRFVERGPHVVEDTETGIFWMKKDSWLDKGKYFNWHEAREYALTKNMRKIGGYEDWRMPTPDEAKTLYHLDFANSAKGGDALHIDKVFPEGSFKAQWVTSDTSTKRPRFDYTNGKIMQVDEYVFGAVRLCRRPSPIKDDRRPRIPVRR